MARPAPSPVTITRFANGAVVSKEIAAPTRAGYILVAHEGHQGDDSRVVRRSTTLSGVVVHWFDRGGEGGDCRVYHASGEALTDLELDAARRQMGEMA